MVDEPLLRRELHYGDRVVRCFADRPKCIDEMFRQVVIRHPDRVALVLDGQRISYRDVDAKVEFIAGNLIACGFEKGERIALLLGNCLEFVYSVLAAARVGIVVVPMNIRQRKPEIEFVLNQCEAACLIYQASLAENVPEPNLVPHLRSSFVVGGTGESSFDVLLTPAQTSRVDVVEEDVFCLLYTSGTTGKPKGAMLTHLGTIHSVMHYEYGMGLLRDGEISILAVPASHVTGLVANILTMIRVFGSTVLMPTFKARTFLEIAEREGMTHSLMVPAMYNLCLLEPDFLRFGLSRWRIGGFGGAPMPEATIARLAKALPGLALVNAYGSTETTSPATLLPLGDHEHPDSVGKAVHCADVIVVDDDGREVLPGASGELWIGGPMVVPGYWSNPEANNGSFAGGHWRSGDIGSVDKHGYVRVFDRKKDMINRAGYKVYCIEVENVLANHPGVVECAVVGRADPVIGERVQAFVVPREPIPSEADLRTFCAERLSDYKVPEAITFLSTPLPRNVNGKILKTALREMLVGCAP
jgi:long-chain acyl-CoA synthetase